MKRVVILSFGICLAALPVKADEHSERAYSAGLVQIHSRLDAPVDAGRYGSALGAFAAAVRADPKDAYARYYHGVMLARSGSLSAGISELRRALVLKPGFAEAAADLGVALVRAGRDAEAIPLLRQAARTPALYARSNLVLGVAQLRLGKTRAATEHFRVARSDSDLALIGRYYNAVALTRLGDLSAARDDFEWVARRSPASELGREAQRYLRHSAAAGVRPYRITLALGVDYDSNVILESDALVAASSPPPDRGDGSTHLRLNGRYLAWRGEDTALTVGYEFFQRIQFDLHNYNLQAHRPGFRLTHRWRALRFGLSGEYDFFFLKDHRYMQRVTALPWVAMFTGNWGRAELSYRARWNDFFRPPPEAVRLGGVDDDVLDSVGQRAMLRQYFYLDGPARFLSLAYRFDSRDAIWNGAQALGYSAHGVEIGAGWLLPWQTYVQASYVFQKEEYRGDGRVDKPHDFSAMLVKRLTSHLSARLAYRGLEHESNRFDYDRHIGSLAMEYTF